MVGTMSTSARQLTLGRFLFAISVSHCLLRRFDANGDILLGLTAVEHTRRYRHNHVAGVLGSLCASRDTSASIQGGKEGIRIESTNTEIECGIDEGVRGDDERYQGRDRTNRRQHAGVYDKDHQLRDNGVGPLEACSRGMQEIAETDGDQDVDCRR